MGAFWPLRAGLTLGTGVTLWTLWTLRPLWTGNGAIGACRSRVSGVSLWPSWSFGTSGSLWTECAVGSWCARRPWVTLRAFGSGRSRWTLWSGVTLRAGGSGVALHSALARYAKPLTPYLAVAF